MSIGSVCSREVVTLRRSDPLSTAAKLMCEQHVGSIVVIDDHGGSPFPIGMLTDRDILRAQLRRASDLNCLSVEEALTPDPLVLIESEDVASGVERMRARGVRRAPVTDKAGALVGIVSVDDLLSFLANQVAGIARLIESQPRREAVRI